MKPKFMNIFLVIVVVSFLSSLIPIHAHADQNKLMLQDDKNSCYSLDVIFVIDQSGTMSDLNYATDPYLQRKTAVQAMISWLGSNVLDVCKDARHQVGVISFGSEARIDLPLTMLAPDSMAELLALEKRIEGNIKADHIPGTEPLAAFHQISKMFEDGKITGGGVRKRVVIMLTDGLIGSDKYTDNPPLGFVFPTQVLADYINEEFPFDPILLEREQCISFQIEAYGTFDNIPYEKVNECYSSHLVEDQAYEASTYIFVVLMNFGSAWPSDVKVLYKNITNLHAGGVLDIYGEGYKKNGPEIPSYFSTRLSNLIGVPTGQVQCGGVAVNPYLEKATFVFYKFSPDTKVSLRYTDSQGVQHQVVDGVSATNGFDVIDYQVNGTNERYIFKKPYPGIWFIESDQCSGNGINAFYQPVQINPGGFTLAIPSLPMYDIPPYFDKTYPTYLTYQMRNDAGEIISNSDQPLFELNVDAVVIDPSGESREYDLAWMPQDQIFKATEPLEIPLSGTYKVSYKGRSQVHVGDLTANSEVLSEVFDSEKILFEHENLEFTVNNVNPFSFSVVVPANGQTLPQIHGTILSGWPLPVVPVPVRVEVHGRILEEGEELEKVPTEQILLNPDKTFAAWLVSADKSRQSEVVYLKPDPENPNVFTGDIPWDDSTEQTTLHVELQGEFAEGYGPDFRKVETSFTRRDASPFYREGFYFFLLGLVILFLVFLVIWYIWMHTNPVGGILIIYKDNVAMERIDVFTGRRISTFKYKGRGVDINVINVRKQPKPKDAEEDVDEIFVYGTTECKQPIAIKLFLGDKSGYCSTHYDYELQYEK